MKLIKSLILVLSIGIAFWIWQNKKIELINISPRQTHILNQEIQKSHQILITPTTVLIKENKPTLVITPTITITPKTTVPRPTVDDQPWGIAKQVDEVTWTIKIGEDDKMATPLEILEALNEYRNRYGSQALTWDNKLGDYAQSRAEYLNSIKNVDKHEGFNNFIEKEDGFNKLGFTMLGENISFGYKLNGVHTIEWMYAGDKPHNDNQLDNRWNYVGIGVDGLATCLIFGTGKM